MKKFKATLKDLSKYNNMGERTVTIEAVNRYWATDAVTRKFRGYELVKFDEVTEEVAE